ncbi:MAG: DsbA family protein [Pseudomonadales bacterium]
MNPLQSARPLIVYLDFKSPYAYLAVRPTMAMARELGIAIDWRPFVLDIPSYLGSAKLDQSGRVVEQQRSAEQWSGVKYAYFDCRRYASLDGLTVRGTVKIWDTNLVAVGMLWARQQGDAILERYIHGVYAPFWKRQLDVEDSAVIQQMLTAAGAEVSGFESYARGPGAAENAALQQAAFSAGIFGVPSYVVGGQLYFGREHLPRIRWHLDGEQGPAPDIGYVLPEQMLTGAGGEGAASDRSLEVCIDFKSPQSYLAVAPTLALAAELGIAVDWQPKLAAALKRPAAPAAGDDRGTAHRRLRAAYLAADLARYAPHPLADVHADFDASVAAMGLLWLRRRSPAAVDDYVQRTFVRYWRHGLAIDTVAAVVQVLTELGIDGSDFAGFASGPGPAALQASERALGARGVMATPTYLLGDEPFLGRQHLPLLRARLTGY